MQNKNYQPIIYSLILLIGIVLGSKVINNSETENYKSKAKVNAILQLIDDNYVDALNLEEFEEKVINSIMRELDPHSVYVSKKEFSYQEATMNGSFSGVGIEFNIIEDTIVVITPISGGPSEKLGIKSGDRIVEVEDENIAGIGIDNNGVIDRLRGEKDSKVNVKIKRRGSENLIEYDIVRGDIPLYSVDASFILEGNIGYIKVNRFAATTNREFYEASVKLLQNGMQKLILDLRGNGGGYLHAAIYMCNEFLEDGNLIVYTEGRNRKRENVYSDEEGNLKNIELIILIDEGSASASEIVSGCMQDNDRATIIGKRSFGKGLVQEEVKLADGSAVRVTTQRYYTPVGRCIQKPYGASDKEYYLEQFTREENESFPDSLKFETKSGKVVYGGGGITPDIVIVKDTNMTFTKINYVFGWIEEFCLIEKKSVINKIGEDYKVFEKQPFEKGIYTDFVKFVSEKDKDFDFTLNTIQEDYLKNFLKARVARSIWGEEVYRKILTQNDDYITKALELLNQ